MTLRNVSNVKCTLCERKLKQKIVDRVEKPEYCYKHYPMSKPNRVPRDKRKKAAS